ncbi:MAG: hypothetical protein U5K54_18965 [Cytophagales bacterium]|nr:hypothetical protein [Cytophagales bacterium]
MVGIESIDEPTTHFKLPTNLNHAKVFYKITNMLLVVSGPGLNVMYADRSAEISRWWAVAKLAIRPSHVASKFFLDESCGNDDMLASVTSQKIHMQ